ncbi:uncharacterized protein TM35_000131010 [Trypanosoma theileri]|uniref:Uncharacterized protein n=1 Tax=Trypanosoma theileri TaxID=67003 RepID=A0A1X0NWL6_9TRYP|nr:uncharacterized protein TM35_000131010 [Trypanosoma theileri]ORC89097.1 hypothetical protein TM35_000131010 [Trypanosoma theileri]
MRWALTRQRINSAEVQQILQRHQDSIHAQSTLWLSKAQVRDYYRIQCRGGVTIDAEGFKGRSIFCISEYSSNERRRLLSIQSPPVNRDDKWLLLTTAGSSSTSLTWTPATLEEYFYASLFACGEGMSNETLLVDAKVALPSSPSRTISLFNAQETSNPFLIDEALQHTHLITGKPFSHTISSALSTLWSQFGYISLKWIPHDEICNLQGIAVSPGEEPHRVYDLEPVDLVHFTQTDDEYQKNILHSIPRWALLQSLKSPIILFGTRCLTWRQMNLDMDIKGNRCTTTTLNPQLRGFPTSQHDIWIHCDHNLLYSGAPQRRHIVHRKLFYNSSQLLV